MDHGPDVAFDKDPVVAGADKTVMRQGADCFAALASGAERILHRILDNMISERTYVIIIHRLLLCDYRQELSAAEKKGQQDQYASKITDRNNYIF